MTEWQHLRREMYMDHKAATTSQLVKHWAVQGLNTVQLKYSVSDFIIFLTIPKTNILTLVIIKACS